MALYGLPMSIMRKNVQFRRLRFIIGTDRISGKVRFRPDIRLQFPVPVPVRLSKNLPDFSRKMFTFLGHLPVKKFLKKESLESFDHVINFTCLVRLASLACLGSWYLGSTSCLIKQAR